MGRLPLFRSTALAGLLVAPSAFAGSPAPVLYPESQKLPWSGFYVGANAGYAWAQDPNIGCVGVDYPCTSVTFPVPHAAGAIFGAQAGYNWQVGNFVVGVEGDVSKLFAQGQAQFPGIDTAKGPDRLSSSYDWLGTARARIGLTSGSALFYTTGGLAYGRVGHQYVYGTGMPSDTQTFNVFENHLGWTVGGGAEYAFNRNWSVRAEYLYVHLDNSVLDISSAAGNSAGTSVLHFNNNLSIVRLGANYRF